MGFFLRKNLIFSKVLFLSFLFHWNLGRCGRGGGKEEEEENLGAEGPQNWDNSSQNHGKSGRGFAKTLRQHRPENIKLEKLFLKSISGLKIQN